MIDPNQFVITRKRKKYKFAKFANAKNCFEYDEWMSKSRPAIDQDIVLEIGAGTGLFSVELASRYKQLTFIALDVKADRLQKGAYEALEQKLYNVYFVRARADQIDQMFAPNSIRAIWITFADPFGRARSAGRRLSHPGFLAKYRTILQKDKKDSMSGLFIKHDNPEFFNWTLEQLVADKWGIQELSFDLHDSDMPDDYKILTTYEKRWLDAGRKVGLVRAGT